MTAPIGDHLREIQTLCRQFGVGRLELFGSGARGDYIRGQSDLDFLVDFQSHLPLCPADRYFGLLHGLEDLLHTRIDLVERASVTNPYFLPVAEKHLQLLYAA